MWWHTIACVIQNNSYRDEIIVWLVDAATHYRTCSFAVQTVVAYLGEPYRYRDIKLLQLIGFALER